MKVSRLRKYNIRNISLEKSYTKCDKETITTAFLRKPKLSTSLDQSHLTSLSTSLACQVEDYQKRLKLRYTPLVFTSYKSLLKIKLT